MNKKALTILGAIYAALITLEETGVIYLLPIEEEKKNLYRVLGFAFVSIIGFLIGKKKRKLTPYPPDKSDKIR